MPDSIPASTLAKFTTFGDLLRFLRRRAGITQVELSIAVGYSDPQISRLEQNLRLPDIPTLEARFVPALGIQDEPEVITRLLDLAANVKREDAPVYGLCPYKGLNFFDEADADLFVGREALTAKLEDRVVSLSAGDTTVSDRFLAIVGASGSGKSSLVRAGLVPALRWDKRSANWPIHILTPSAHPLESLAVSLTQGAGSVNATLTLVDDLKRDQRSLSVYINRILKTTGAPFLLLFVDQFEELFALCRSEEERLAFIDNLLASSAKQDGQGIIVITLRADFYASCAGYPQLRQALARNQEYIGAMNHEELRRVIEEPARRGRWEVEPGLTDLILHDVGHEPGALPLLSHALFETWQRRHGRMLTFSGYSSAGGVRGAIAETAEAVFVDQFTPEQQAIARRIFLRMTELGGETAAGDTRREVKFSELILKPEEAIATRAVLKALADARLITTSQDSAQVAHEALIREWPTLRSWLEENREGLRLHRHLTDASQEWITSNREPDLLYRGIRLAQSREWASYHADDLNLQERDFLEASVALDEREAIERQAQQQREVEAAQKLAESERQRAEVEKRRAEEAGLSARRLRRRAIYLSLMLVATFILVGVAIVLARQASESADLARNNMSLAQGASTQAVNEANTRATAQSIAVNEANTRATAESIAVAEAHKSATAEAQARSSAGFNLSLILASAAQQANQAGQGDLALALALEAVKGSPESAQALLALRSVALSPGTRLVLSGHSMAVRTVAISSDDKKAASGSCTKTDAQGNCQGGELIVWDLTTGKALTRWAAYTDWVNVVTFSLDGHILISGGEDGQVTLWDAATGQKIRDLETQPKGITSLAIDRQTGALLSGSKDGTLILWDLSTGAIRSRLTDTGSPVNAISIALSKPLAVSGHADGSLILWDLSNAQSIHRFEENGFAVNDVAISHDGSSLLVTAGLQLLKIDAQSGAVASEQSWGAIPGKLAVSADETYTLVSRGIVSQFDLRNWRDQSVFFGSGKSVTALSISRDKPLGLVGYLNGEVRLLDLVDALDYQPYEIGMQLDAVVPSPDGKYLLLGNMYPSDQNLVLWDIAGARVMRTYSGFDGALSPGSVDISPDGRLVAAGGGYLNKPVYHLMVWDLSSGEVICNFEIQNAIPRSIAFSPDSRFLLEGTQELQMGKQAVLEGTQSLQVGELNELNLWDVNTCQRVRRFDLQPTEDVTGIAFSADGKWAITGSAYVYPNRIVLWDVNTGKELRRYVSDSPGIFPILDVAFGPGDRTILGGQMAPLYLWDVQTGQILRRFIGHTSFPWSLDISPDGKYVLSGNENEVILWDFASGQELQRLTVHKQPVFGLTFSPDGQVGYSVSPNGMLVKWQISVKSLPELLDWIQANRYVRDLSCDERSQYGVEPLCKP